VEAVTGLRWPWLAVALAVLLVVLLVRWSRRPRSSSAELPVARTARLRSLPRYRVLARHELIVAAVCTAGALLVVAGSILLAARPSRLEWAQPDRNGRDIQLCLDVSASMDRWNRQVVESFQNIVSELSGERLGLTIFSGAAAAVFPLTDDYEFVRAKLEEAEHAFRTADYDYFAGAETVARRASQAGDGLVSCVQRLGDPEAGRGRAVVLASDNDPLGRPVFSLQEAAVHAVREDVVVYGIGTPDLEDELERAAEFTSAVEATGGRLALLREDGDVAAVVAGIQRQERARLKPVPTGVRIDDPEPAFWWAAAGVAVLLLGGLLRWRAR
jgi:Ca-activated chloride channel homolog